MLARPLSFAFLTVFAVIMAALIFSFLLLGTYTRRTTVSGHLAPHNGVLKVISLHNSEHLSRRLKNLFTFKHLQMDL